MEISKGTVESGATLCCPGCLPGKNIM